MRIPIGFWQRILLWLALGMLLAGCTDAPPTPASMVTTAALEPAVTNTPELTSTPPATSTATGTCTPTATSTPAATSTPTATLTPTATCTPSPTPTPTLTSTPAPSPTSQPDVRLDVALRHQTNGNYDLAIVTYQDLLKGASSPEQSREAAYHLAEAYLMNGEDLAAVTSFEEFLTDYPDDTRVPEATLMLARALEAANEYPKAISYYQAYLDYDSLLADMVYEWVGDCHAAKGSYEEAIAAYRQAAGSTRDSGVRATLLEKIAELYLDQEAYDAALVEYDAILDTAEADTYRARIEFLAGQALAASGQTDAAFARYQHVVDRYPKAEYAYHALIELVEAGIPVGEFQRGLVDYYAGPIYADAYGAAIRAFDRYLAAEPSEKADEALYRKALAQRSLDQLDAALDTLEILIAGYPKSTWLVQAWLQKAATLAMKDANDQAVQAYEDLAAFFPANELAPQALWRAAKLREGQGAFVAAADLYRKVQRDFPSFESADEALWRAGLSHYRAGGAAEAVGVWETLLEEYPKSSFRPRTLYWLGKLGASPAVGGEAAYWDRLVAQNAGQYYALRVQQVRAGDSLTASRLITAAIEAPSWQAEKAEDELLDWLDDWTDVPTGTLLVSLPDAISRRLDLRRGEALLAVGLRRPALDALDRVRAAVWKDPVPLAQLAFYFRERGWHGLAARCALRLAGLWPQGSLYDAPLPLQRLAYPLAYADLLSTESQARDLDPLLLAALIRQESLFEPVAESYAGARGLGQVMPATGEGIARSLHIDDFELDDLFRPAVSVRFGAFYLDVQMGRFDDQVLISLAAYNGGPGNTLRWLELSGDDLDLFVEVITAEQSRRYLQTVYEQYFVYERLYRSTRGE